MRTVEWAGGVIFGGTSLLLILVFLLHAKLSLQDMRRQKFMSVWRPILVNIEAAPSDLPVLARRDQPQFLVLWNQLHESLPEEANDHLNQIAQKLGIGTAALRMLRRRNMRHRLLAILTLGQLGERAAFDQLLRMARTAGPLLSVVAARALVRIDSKKAAPELLPLLVKRPDWPSSRVATVLQTAGADVISDLIAKAAIESTLRNDDESTEGKKAVPINYGNRLIQYFLFTHRESAVPAVQTIFQSSRDPEVLAACLRLLRTSAGLAFARDCLTHDDWRVRVQASAALGRIGQPEDEARLIPLLSDKEWWVRYRAAQALSFLPSMRESKLKSIRAAQSDPFARDMLTQVMAEAQLR